MAPPGGSARRWAATRSIVRRNSISASRSRLRSRRYSADSPGKRVSGSADSGVSLVPLHARSGLRAESGRVDLYRIPSPQHGEGRWRRDRLHAAVGPWAARPVARAGPFDGAHADDHVRRAVEVDEGSIRKVRPPVWRAAGDDGCRARSAPRAAGGSSPAPTAWVRRGRRPRRRGRPGSWSSGIRRTDDGRRRTRRPRRRSTAR